MVRHDDDQRAEALERTIARAANGEALVLGDTLNARYQVEGEPGPDDWPEFQLDGPAIWLWSLAKYVNVCRARPLPLYWENAVDLTARYIWRRSGSRRAMTAGEERSSDAALTPWRRLSPG